MKKIKFSNLSVFVLFFGIALMEAFQQKSWPLATLFLALGIISLWVDIRKKGV